MLFSNRLKKQKTNALFVELEKQGNTFHWAFDHNIGKLIQQGDFHKLILIPRECLVGLHLEDHALFVPNDESTNGHIGWLNTVPVVTNNQKHWRTNTVFISRLTPHGQRLLERLQ